MLAEERRQKITELLQHHQRVVAKELADLFQVSVDSIRRDLTMMEEQGQLKKTYGGAVPLTQVRQAPTDTSVRYGPGASHQNAISRMAASLIKENDTVFIGSAGIQYGMLKYLPTSFPFSLVTNSLKIAETIRHQSNIEGYMIGGKLRGGAGGSMIDTLAIEQINRFTLDIAFVTGGGISVKGISTATPELASFIRAVTEVSRRRIGLAPHEKIGVNMFARSIPLSELDLLITDEQTPERALRELKDKDVDVAIAIADPQVD